MPLPRRRRTGRSPERRVRRERPIPPSYRAYALSVALAAVLVLVLVVPAHDWGASAGQPGLWLLVALVLAGELLPIQVPHKYAYDRVHVSSAFALALLLAFGPAPALLAYLLCSVVADVLQRTPRIITVFNAGQYVLTLASGAAVLALAGQPAPVASVADALGAVLLAAAVCFAVNHVLVGVSSALLTGSEVGPYLRADLWFHVSTDGFQLALAPLIVVAVDASPWLLTVAVVPVAAIYLGGRQAAINGYRAAHDVLTDLPNRWAFNEQLAKAVREARGQGGGTVLLMLDLDDFKLVNDTLGHHNGDELLRQVAERLRGGLRSGDVLARLGGDEFALLPTPGTGVREARELAERLLAAIDAPFEIEHLQLDIGASVGIAATAHADEQADDLLRNADNALYEAKRSGADVAVASGQPSPTWRTERLGIGSELREGIGRGELFLEFQPKLSLGHGAPQGAEALVRWQHPHLGVVLPEHFVQIAEQSGLIKALALEVLDAAIAQGRRWLDAGQPIRVSVNLSTRNLLDAGLPQDVGRLLAEHGLPARLLQLEVTESRIASDLNRTRTVLEELRAMGVMIAIDDFGTGFSSLSQLQQLPVDEIKIDKSFVLGMGTSPQDAAIVRSTIDLGRNLHLTVTAEGVESQEVLETLTSLGCDALQGFFIGRPQTAEACARTLEAHVPLAEAA